MNQTPVIIFVCEHGAAKSIIAAAYYNKLAEERNMETRAIARGTHPDQELSPKTITGLREDDLTPTASTPQKLSPAEVETAQSIVTFCELPEEYQNKVEIEKWDNVPPVSESYEKARDAILEKLNHLLK
jgi:protein-tyrosine-phosphatase